MAFANDRSPSHLCHRDMWDTNDQSNTQSKSLLSLMVGSFLVSKCRSSPCLHKAVPEIAVLANPPPMSRRRSVISLTLSSSLARSHTLFEGKVDSTTVITPIPSYEPKACTTFNWIRSHDGLFQDESESTVIVELTLRIKRGETDCLTNVCDRCTDRRNRQH